MRRVRGGCEKSNITLCLPGEAEYIANKLDVDFASFIKKYCNTVALENGNRLYILKAGMCPFLNNQKVCDLEKTNSKPIRCMLYPILIGFPDDKRKIFVDFEDCPMANKLTDEFIAEAKKIYEDISEKIPEYWLDFVSKYDYYVYDYSRLGKLRDKEIITLEDLESCRLE